MTIKELEREVPLQVTERTLQTRVDGKVVTILTVNGKLHLLIGGVCAVCGEKRVELVKGGKG